MFSLISLLGEKENTPDDYLSYQIMSSYPPVSFGIFHSQIVGTINTLTNQWLTYNSRPKNKLTVLWVIYKPFVKLHIIVFFVSIESLY